jgi:hypothetical protein
MEIAISEQGALPDSSNVLAVVLQNNVFVVASKNPIGGLIFGPMSTTKQGPFRIE